MSDQSILKTMLAQGASVKAREARTKEGIKRGRGTINGEIDGAINISEPIDLDPFSDLDAFTEVPDYGTLKSTTSIPPRDPDKPRESNLPRLAPPEIPTLEHAVTVAAPERTEFVQGILDWAELLELSDPPEVAFVLEVGSIKVKPLRVVGDKKSVLLLFKGSDSLVFEPSFGQALTVSIDSPSLSFEGKIVVSGVFHASADFPFAIIQGLIDNRPHGEKSTS